MDVFNNLNQNNFINNSIIGFIIEIDISCLFRIKYNLNIFIKVLFLKISKFLENNFLEITNKINLDFLLFTIEKKDNKENFKINFFFDKNIVINYENDNYIFDKLQNYEEFFGHQFNSYYKDDIFYIYRFDYIFTKNIKILILKQSPMNELCFFIKDTIKLFTTTIKNDIIEILLKKNVKKKRINKKNK